MSIPVNIPLYRSCIQTAWPWQHGEVLENIDKDRREVASDIAKLQRTLAALDEIYCDVHNDKKLNDILDARATRMQAQMPPPVPVPGPFVDGMGI